MKRLDPKLVEAAAMHMQKAKRGIWIFVCPWDEMPQGSQQQRLRYVRKLLRSGWTFTPKRKAKR